jgi:hypothetical protein
LALWHQWTLGFLDSLEFPVVQDLLQIQVDPLLLVNLVIPADPDLLEHLEVQLDLRRSLEHRL